MTSLPTRLARALEHIDQANFADPNQVQQAGQWQAKEYLYSQQMTHWLWQLEAAPSELMQIACRAQHIERWSIPRQRYPEGRAGYYQWRSDCGQMHGQRAAELMALAGYPDEDCAQVQRILTKRELRQDADTQLLEDVACLVFLESYFADFYQQKPDYNREQWLRIASRTWQKMTARGQQQALRLAAKLPEPLQALLHDAIVEGQ